MKTKPMAHMKKTYAIPGLLLALCYSGMGNGGTCDEVLADTFNIAACGTTQTALFNLQSAARVNTVNIWYNTQLGGPSLPFNLQGPGAQLSGTFQAKGCDPFQSQWCEGQFVVNKTLRPGQYTIITAAPAVCQNPDSGGNGFVKVKGCFISTKAKPDNLPPTTDDNPEGGNTKDCIPGTNPFQEDACVRPKFNVPTVPEPRLRVPPPPRP